MVRPFHTDDPLEAVPNGVRVDVPEDGTDPSPTTVDATGAYDALADLFLSDGPMAPRAASTRQPPDARGDRAPAAVAANGAASDEPRTAHTTDPLRETSPRTDPAEPDAAARTGPGIDALILGHLPVLGSAWVGQFARHQSARSSRPVALARLTRGHLTIEVFGLEPGAPSEAGSLNAAVRWVAARGMDWLVRVDETDEPIVARLPGIRRVTLLTGPDEAAVVACYRAIKLLDPADPDVEPPPVSLAVMGAGEPVAGEAHAKLARAVRTFLGRSVEYAGCVAQISATGGRVIYRGTPGTTAQTFVAMLAAAEPAADPQPITPTAAPCTEPGPAPSLATGAATAGMNGAPAPEPAALPVVQRAESAETPEDRTEAWEPEVSGALCAHVPGLVPLGARCPYADAELASDAQGRLHVLAACAGEQDAGRAVAALTSVGAWATAHAALLKSACRGLRMEGAPILHLFTAEPRSARRLLDTDLSVHVLAPVRVGGATAWYCARMN